MLAIAHVRSTPAWVGHPVGVRVRLAVDSVMSPCRNRDIVAHLPTDDTAAAPLVRPRPEIKIQN